MNTEEWEVLKEGTWLYANEVECKLRILKHGLRYGTGDYEDDEEIREDQQGEFYYIEFNSPPNAHKHKTRVGAYSSLEEALNEAHSATHGTLKWK